MTVRVETGPGWRVVHSGCVEAMREMPEASVDAIVTDPPYELGFMGKRWDSTGIAYSLDLWREALRVLKPGGHLCAFGGTRTYHRMACAIEDAGFEIRDSLHWIYGSGFPKSLDVSKAVDRRLGVAPTVTGEKSARLLSGHLDVGSPTIPTTIPTTIDAARWNGWGTALKPAHEPIILARKPLDGTVAANVLRHGTGALNINAGRIRFASEEDKAAAAAAASQRSCRDQNAGRVVLGRFENGPASLAPYLSGMDAGRWPPNVLLGEDAAEEMDRQSGETVSNPNPNPNFRNAVYGRGMGGVVSAANQHNDSGGASRFFPVFRYVAKPARGERDAGLWDVEVRSGGEATDRADGSAGLSSPRAGAGRTGGARNHHPTVKPIALMEWLVRLVTPPGGTVLDPFLGSGTTGCAAVRCGDGFIGIEREAEYVALAERRIALAANAPRGTPLGSLSRDDGALPGQSSLFASAPLRREGGE